jgi:FkbM family methyltransferase
MQAKTLLERQEPRSRVLHGGYVGHGRVLIDSALDLPVLASATDLSLTPELLRTGDYDGRFREFVLRTVRPGARVVDVGANIGYFTLAMAKACGVHGHVHAFEPNPAVVPLLRDNVRMNDFDRRVTVHPVAAAARAGSVPFSHNPAFLGGSYVGAANQHGARPNSDEVEVIEVEAVRLDAVLADVRRIALVKIDVEGREADVLDGLVGLLDRNAIGALDLEILEDAIGNRWDAFAETFSSVVEKYRASLSVLDRHGRLVGVSLDEVLSERHYLHVVVEFPS